MALALPLSRFPSIPFLEREHECRNPEDLDTFYRQEFSGAPLLVVTNREPIIWQKGGHWSLPPGGVSQTIHRLLGQVGGEWIALKDSSGPDLLKVPFPKEGKGYLLRRVALSSELRHEHYVGFANGVLWPFFHDQKALIDRSRDYFPSYARVNRQLAGQILESLTTCPAGAVWIHDYQLALVAGEVRRMAGHHLPPMAFFWHIPWVLTADDAPFSENPWLIDLVEGLLQHDHVGFQTEQYRDHFILTVRQIFGEDRVFWDGQSLTVSRLAGESTLTLGVHPVSIDSDHFDRLSRDPVGLESARKVLGEAGLLLPNGVLSPFLISVERMDYSKGFMERLNILEALFTHYPSWVGRLSLLQVAPPSRQEVGSYRHYADHVGQAIQKLNDRFGRNGWHPVRTVPRSLDQKVLAPLYRLSSGALITATRDGMNLVAKEFLASQKGRDGILFLSRFTGAAQTMEGACLIDPFDPIRSARIIHQGLSLDSELRKRRNARLQEDLTRHNVYRWMMENLRAFRQTPLSVKR